MSDMRVVLSEENDALIDENKTLRARIAKLEAALRGISLMDKQYEHDLFSATCVARAALEGK